MRTGQTIFAVSTAPGRSGVAVIRVSGIHAGDALRSLGGSVDYPRMARLVSLADPGSSGVLDQAITLWFPGPASFTGEDVAELHVHGGQAVIAAVLRVLGSIPGLEEAEPGDFTRRAFANGKLDLTEIEGLADLIAAETEAQRRMALRQMAGGLSELYQGWRTRLVGLLAHVEAEIDFAEEEVPEGIADSTIAEVLELADIIEGHLDDARKGERLRGGYRVVLAGPPNAGKSSLLNALARRDAAIVSPEPGTTRDLIDVSLDLGGYPVEVTDTAGIREAYEAVEKDGVQRALSRASSADLVLWLVPANEPKALPAPSYFKGDVLVVTTKNDLSIRPVDGVSVTVVSETGLEHLLSELQARVKSALGGDCDGVITRVRHRKLVERTRDGLLAAVSAREDGVELVAENLRTASLDLGRLTERVDVEDLLDVIFAEFCIGK